MIPPAEVRLERLTPKEIEAHLRRRSVVYQPIGALEFHGPHLPIGLDGLTAHGVCVAAAQLAGGVVAPTIYQGVGGEHADYPWTIMMSAEQPVFDNLMDATRRFADLGVCTTVILSGHFADEQRAMLRRLAVQWQELDEQMRLIATTLADRPSPPIAPDHAGIFETTLLAGVHPDLVRVEQLPEDPATDPGGNPFGRHRHDPRHPLWGIFGPDPRQADLGSADSLVRSTAAWLSQLVTGDGPSR